MDGKKVSAAELDRLEQREEAEEAVFQMCASQRPRASHPPPPPPFPQQLLLQNIPTPHRGAAEALQHCTTLVAHLLRLLSQVRLACGKRRRRRAEGRCSR